MPLFFPQTDFDLSRSMIFNPLIVVASELGLGGQAPRKKADAGGEAQIVTAYRRVKESYLGSVIVDSVNDDEADAAKASGAYTVRTDLAEFGRTHNYRSNSGAERIAATVNRFDRYYTHDIVVAVPDDLAELKPHYLQALMYALASSEVGIATLVSPLRDGERDDYGVVKASVDWNSDRLVHPVEGSKVGSLKDIRRNAAELGEGELYRFVPIHAWRRGPLDRLVAMPPSERELDEGTDLVRALDAGVRVDVALVWEDMKVLIRPEELIGDGIEG
jgi:3-deoxy-manno-octulosonate cytidylyltransferase (CMP-KDO synthetase)